MQTGDGDGDGADGAQILGPALASRLARSQEPAAASLLPVRRPAAGGHALAVELPRRLAAGSLLR